MDTMSFNFSHLAGVVHEGFKPFLDSFCSQTCQMKFLELRLRFFKFVIHEPQ